MQTLKQIQAQLCCDFSFINSCPNERNQRGGWTKNFDLSESLTTDCQFCGRLSANIVVFQKQKQKNTFQARCAPSMKMISWHHIECAFEETFRTVHQESKLPLEGGHFVS